MPEHYFDSKLSSEKFEATGSVKKRVKEMIRRFCARIGRSVAAEKSKVITMSEPTVLSESILSKTTTKSPTTEILPDITKKSITQYGAVEKNEVREIFPHSPEIINTTEYSGGSKGEKTEKKSDKGIYESITTNNYFEGWSEIELEGNPEIKDTIRENIMRSEVNNQYHYQQAADELKISVEEFKKRLQEKVEDMVGQAEFFIATQPCILEQIMNVDGRWKSQFETFTSQGGIASSFIAEIEKEMFGFEGDFEKDNERRPIYGYFSDDEHGGLNDTSGKIPPPTNVSNYGTINIKIKKERAMKKATITFQDSSLGATYPPTPAIKPHFTSFRFEYLSGFILNELKGSSIVNWGAKFTEVQYHGQLTIEDVESIYISRANGVFPEEIEEIRTIFNKYKSQHPESTIELIEF